MLVQPENNQKKLILSTTEVTKMLLSQGRRKINESILSHGAKNSNNIDLTDLTSQINTKLSKEVENANMVSMVDQSMLKPFGEKSIYKQRNAINPLDKSGFVGDIIKFNQKENGNILSKLEKSQIGIGTEGLEQNQDIRSKKRLLRLDSTEIGVDKNNMMKMGYIINNYFPYENENNLNLDSAKLKNFLVIFYFRIENSTFVLIKKLDKKLVPLYFWNKEEDAKKFGINYSQINTPGLYFKTFDNFKRAFNDRFQNLETAEKMKVILKEKQIEFEQNIQKIKDEYELKIKELMEKNEELNTKITEYENDNIVKNNTIQELAKKINFISNKLNELKLINEKLVIENQKLKNNYKINTKNNIDNHPKINENRRRLNKAKTRMDINFIRKSKINFNKEKIFINQIAESKNERDTDNSRKEENDSFPNLDEFEIDDEDEEKINKKINIGNIKTYGERTHIYKKNSINNNYENNIFISIKDSINTKEKNNIDSPKNKNPHENLNNNKKNQKSPSSSNIIESQEESSNI